MTAPTSKAGFPVAEEQFAVRPATSQVASTVPSQGARELYRQFFETVVVADDDQSLRNDVYRLRYQVYCVENPFEDPSDKLDGLESDVYDERAAHCLLRHRRTSFWAGAARLILPNKDAPAHSFALQEVCRDPMIEDPARFPVNEMAEVSRFCVSKEFRKRQGDGLMPQSNEPEDQKDERRVVPNMILGLIEGLVDMSIRNGIVYWCAVMEPPLLRLLSRLGINFESIGPLVDYHGRRQPSLLRLPNMLKNVSEVRPDVWEILTDGGRHWDRLASAPSARFT